MELCHYDSLIKERGQSSSFVVSDFSKALQVALAARNILWNHKSLEQTFMQWRIWLVWHTGRNPLQCTTNKITRHNSAYLDI